MQAQALEADYLVIGSGAVGMGFIDVLMAESSATVVLVDRHHRPGGHWNDAYPFVRLHSPAAYYGVSSTPLGSGLVEREGDNAGLLDLASGREIAAYYDRVLERLLATGRLRYFPMCEYQGGHEFVSRLSGQRVQVAVRKKLIDATFTRTEVPSTHKPRYTIAAGVRCVPINDLVKVAQPAAGYVVIGGGKTGIDACLWLLDSGVALSSIRWIRPRDAWLHNRAHVQPPMLGSIMMESAATQMEEAAHATSLEDLFLRLEAREELLRIDTGVMPTMFRGATVSKAELAKLRRIEDVVRLGRVQRIERDRIVLERGSVPTSVGALHIDCSADGIALSPDPRPVFEPGRVTVQCVRYLHVTLSAALIGHLEATQPDALARNN
ncbi:MAG TPA: hypothetical protein VJU61_05230, partial [Polyangiaceae bacterium]|nr:hypothetical protein [Polyangiaceae bacterium]